jgi:hypothetical protein
VSSATVKARFIIVLAIKSVSADPVHVIVIILQMAAVSLLVVRFARHCEEGLELLLFLQGFLLTIENRFVVVTCSLEQLSLGGQTAEQHTISMRRRHWSGVTKLHPQSLHTASLIGYKAREVTSTL